MNLSKAQKIILGIFTFLPFILFPIIALQVFYAVIEIVNNSADNEPEPGEILMVVFSFVIPIILLASGCLALLIFYIIHAVSSKKLEPIEQLLWILFFVFFGIIAFPVYWFVRVWNT